MPSLADLKRDPERLHQAATLLEAENKKLIEKNLELQARIDALQGKDPATLQMRIAELEQQLSVRNQALFGDKSEKRNRAARRANKKKHREEERRTDHVRVSGNRWCDASGGRV